MFYFIILNNKRKYVKNRVAETGAHSRDNVEFGGPEKDDFMSSPLQRNGSELTARQGRE
jgi:hypothetical protein